MFTFSASETIRRLIRPMLGIPEQQGYWITSSAGVFITRRDQIAVVGVMVGAVFGRLARDAGMVSGDHVNHAVGSQRQSVSAVLGDIALETNQRLDAINSAVAHFVAQSIQRGLLGPSPVT